MRMSPSNGVRVISRQISKWVTPYTLHFSEFGTLVDLNEKAKMQNNFRITPITYEVMII